MKKTFPVLLLLLAFSQLIIAQTKESVFKEIVRIPASPVKDQQKTGCCWSFATTSFLESEILKNGKGEYDLSEMYFVRLAYLEKAKYYLLYQGKANFGQGGQAHDVVNIIRKRGVVPESEYPGNPLTPGILDHTKPEEALTRLISKTNDNLDEKTAGIWEEKFNRILDENMGKLPVEFGVKGQTYSPVGFADYLGINPDDYWEITSYSHHPFYTKIDLEVPDNWSHDRYINLPVDELVEVIDSALYKGYSVCWDGDTSEKGFNFRKGTATLPFGMPVDQNARQSTFLDRETTDDHLMHIVGISENPEGEKFYYIKNSWGTGKSEYDGFLYMSVPYVKLKTIAIMVNKKAIPKELLYKINY